MYRNRGRGRELVHFLTRNKKRKSDVPAFDKLGQKVGVFLALTKTTEEELHGLITQDEDGFGFLATMHNFKVLEKLVPFIIERAEASKSPTLSSVSKCTVL